MLTWLARRVIRDAWIVLAIWALLALLLLTLSLTGMGGRGLFDRLDTRSSTIAGTESAQGKQILDTLTGDGRTVTLMVRGIDISSPDMQQQVSQALTPFHRDLTELVGTTNVLDPFVVPGMLEQPAARALASQHLDGFLLVVTVDPNGAQKVADPQDRDYSKQVDELVAEVEDIMRTVPSSLHSLSPSVTGIISHDGLMSAAINHQVETDLVRGELIVLPLTLLVMVLVFGGFLAAGMPLLGALVSIGGSFGVLWVLSTVMDLQPFVVNIVTVIGLGLSIDYALLITSRYREEVIRLQNAAQVPVVRADPAEGRRAHGNVRGRTRRRRRSKPHAAAVTTAILTAGRTILFSGLVVALCLFSLILMGTSVLRSIAIASIAVVLIAVLAALTLIPSVLVVLGDHITRPSPLARLRWLNRLQQRLGDVSAEEGFFSRLARLVHRVPWVVLVACVAFLVVLASPLRHAHLLTSTYELLPRSSDQRTYMRVLAEDYPAAQRDDATLILAGTGEQVTAFIADDVATAPGVDAVMNTATAGEYTVVYLDLAGDGTDAASERGVEAVRDLPAPVERWVIGQAASQVDFREAVLSGLGWVGLVVVSAIVVLLFLMTGSILVPLKALLVNSLSLAASLGVLVWVFQEGHLSFLLGFTPIGGIEAYAAVTALGLGFGLAMDYEVFILARIKEYWDLDGNNDAAVERGLQHSGRIVTSAAFIMVLVFLGFVSGEMLVIKQVGFALAIIVAVDATVVRMLLVPATMTLLGRWNWWAPTPLARLYSRFGITH